MALQRLFSGDASKSSTLYLVIGVLSLAKAIAVRKDPDRFRRELLDAGLFIGVGLVLRRYSEVKEQKRAEIESQLPDWLPIDSTSFGDSSGQETESTTGMHLRSRAKQRFGSQPEPEPTLREKAQQVIAQRR